MHHKFSFPEERFLLIGTVGKPQGLKGEVNIHPFSGQPENLHAYQTLFLVDKKGELSPELHVDSFRAHKGKAIILFDRVTDRTFAEKLTGMGVLVARNDIPELDDDEFYYHQFVGLSVKTDDGIELGRLSSFFSNGAQEVMVIDGDDGEYLIPFIKEIIVSQNETDLIINPPPGILDINEDDDSDGIVPA